MSSQRSPRDSRAASLTPAAVVGLPQLRRKFPKVLIAISKEDHRRMTMLHLLKSRFVVEVCEGSSTNLVGLWDHPAKFDAVIAMLDPELDPHAAFAIADIRRLEVLAERQLRASSEHDTRQKLGDVPPTALGTHKAQRFAELQRQKQQKLNAAAAAQQQQQQQQQQQESTPSSPRRRLAAGSPSAVKSSDHVAPSNEAGVFKTLVFGFAEKTRPDVRLAMEKSGHFTRVFTGRPYDEDHLEFLISTLRADYHIEPLDETPTFDDVLEMARLVHQARSSLPSDEIDGVLNDTEPQQGAGGLLRRAAAASSNGGSGTTKASSPPASPVVSTNRSGAALSSKWKNVLTGGVASFQLGGGGGHGGGSAANDIAVMQLERQLHTCKAQLQDASGARDAAEAELRSVHVECQNLRQNNETLRERLAVAEDLKCSLEERLHSRMADIRHMRQELELLLRQPATSSGGEVHHLLQQNQRLRDSVLQFETALHETTADRRALQRKLDRMLQAQSHGLGGSMRALAEGLAGGSMRRRPSAGGPTQAGGTGLGERHQSLARLALPGADEVFGGLSPVDGDGVNAEENNDEKFGDVLVESGSGSSSSEDDEAMKSPSSGASGRKNSGKATGSNSALRRGDSNRRRRSSFVNNGANGVPLTRRKSLTMKQLAVANDRARQAEHTASILEGMLMELCDERSRTRELIQSMGVWAFSPNRCGTGLPIASLTRALKSSSSTVSADGLMSDDSHVVSALVQSWATLEARYGTACQTHHASTGRDALSLLLSTSVPEQGGPSDDVREQLSALLKSHRISDVASDVMASLIQQSFTPTIRSLYAAHDACRRLVIDAMSQCLMRYEQLSKQLPNMIVSPGAAVPAQGVPTVSSDVTRIGIGPRVAAPTPSATPPLASPSQLHATKAAYSALNLFAAYTYQSMKEAIVRLDACCGQFESQLKAAITNATLSLAKVVNPMHVALAAAHKTGVVKRTFELSTQTVESAGATTTASRTRSSFSVPGTFATQQPGSADSCENSGGGFTPVILSPSHGGHQSTTSPPRISPMNASGQQPQPILSPPAAAATAAASANAFPTGRRSSNTSRGGLLTTGGTVPQLVPAARRKSAVQFGGI